MMETTFRNTQSESPRLSFVIVNWNTCQYLELCLNSILETVTSHTFEIFVVDNASSDGSVEMVRTRFYNVKLMVNARNVGFGRANNQAMQCSRGDYIVLLNSDAQLLPNSIDRCISFLDNSPSTGIVGGELLNSDGTFQAGYFSFPDMKYQFRALSGKVREDFAKWKASYSPIPQVRSVDWISGAFMVVRRKAIEQIGLLDERFFMYSEETEWCYRMRTAGWGINFLSEVKVIHHHRQSSSKAPPQLSAHAVRGQLILFWTHYPRQQAILLMLVSIGVGSLTMVRSAFQKNKIKRNALARTGYHIVSLCLKTVLIQKPQVPYLEPTSQI